MSFTPINNVFRTSKGSIPTPGFNSTEQINATRVNQTVHRALAAQQNIPQHQNLSIGNSIPTAPLPEEIVDLANVCPKNLIDLLKDIQNADEEMKQKPDFFKRRRIALIAIIACFAAKGSLFTVDKLHDALKHFTRNNLSQTDGLVQSCLQSSRSPDKPLCKQFTGHHYIWVINIIWDKISGDVEKYLSNEAKQILSQTKIAKKNIITAQSTQSFQPLLTTLHIMEAASHSPYSLQPRHLSTINQVEQASPYSPVSEELSQCLPSVREVERAALRQRQAVHVASLPPVSKPSLPSFGEFERALHQHPVASHSPPSTQSLHQLHSVREIELAALHQPPVVQAPLYPPVSEESEHFEFQQLYPPRPLPNEYSQPNPLPSAQDQQFSIQTLKRPGDNNHDQPVAKKRRTKKAKWQISKGELKILPSELKILPKQLIDLLKDIHKSNGACTLADKKIAIIALAACYFAGGQKVSRKRIQEIIGGNIPALNKNIFDLTQTKSWPLRPLMKHCRDVHVYEVDWKLLPQNVVEYLSPEAHKMWSAAQPKA